MNAIEIAGLKRAIEGMPLQYETPDGERGLKLSGMETILNIIIILLCVKLSDSLSIRTILSLIPCYHSLAGGEKQRVAIVRAVLKNAPLL